jgi:hypothetical protein
MNHTRHLDKSPLLNWVVCPPMNYQVLTMSDFAKQTQMESRNHENDKTNPNNVGQASRL